MKEQADPLKLQPETVMALCGSPAIGKYPDVVIEVAKNLSNIKSAEM